MINTGAGAWINVIGAVAILVVGVFVLWVKPKGIVNRAFALYAIPFALGLVAWNLLWPSPTRGEAWFIAAAGPLWALAAVGMLILSFRYPARLRPDERKWAWVAGTIAVIGTLPNAIIVWGWIDLSANALLWGFSPESTFAWRSWLMGTMFLYPAIGFHTILMALRAAVARHGGPKPSEYAMLGVVLGLWQAILIGSVIPLGFDMAPYYGLAFVAYVLVPAFIWLSQIHRIGKVARNASWALLAAGLFGLVVSTFFGGFTGAANAGLFGLIRLVTAAFIAFAIVRHQALGIDIKFRRGVSRGTIAAIFVSVFFVVEGLAENFFENTAAGPTAGILVAGVLVFFLAPLQRLAERIAGAAVGPAITRNLEHDDRVATYRRTALAAWADGSIDIKERALLDELAEALRLNAETTKRLEREASQIALGDA